MVKRTILRPGAGGVEVLSNDGPRGDRNLERRTPADRARSERNRGERSGLRLPEKERQAARLRASTFIHGGESEPVSDDWGDHLLAEASARKRSTS